MATKYALQKTKLSTQHHFNPHGRQKQRPKFYLGQISRQ
uniref:Uncharacterized protein n=1 Tax=Arundo donax TaxID=35708 RepID=A0A0A9CMH4_ARUDO